MEGCEGVDDSPRSNTEAGQKVVKRWKIAQGTLVPGPQHSHSLQSACGQLCWVFNLGATCYPLLLPSPRELQFLVLFSGRQITSLEIVDFKEGMFFCEKLQCIRTFSSKV